MTTAIQHSFAGGEIAPVLWSRVDTNKYAAGLRAARNGLIGRSGFFMNRPGTEFVGESIFPGKAIRLIPFEFSEEQAYILEFGNYYIHIIQDGEYIYDFNLPISALPNGNNPILQLNNYATGSTGINPGDGILITGVSGAMGPMINDRLFIVSAITAGSPATVQLNYPDGSPVNTTTWGAAILANAVLNHILTVTTPYLDTEVGQIHFDQSADVMTLCHPNHPPRVLSRFAQKNWTLTFAAFWPSQPPSSGNLAGATSGSGGTSLYQVTTVNLQTGEESFPGFVGGITTTSKQLTPTGTASINGTTVTASTTTNHGMSPGQSFSLTDTMRDTTGNINVALAGKTYIVLGTPSGTQFTFTGEVSLPPQNLFYFTPTFIQYPTIADANNITAVGSGNPLSITTKAAHGITAGAQVLIQGTGIFGIDNNVFVATPDGSNNKLLYLNGLNGANYNVGTYGGSGGYIAVTTLSVPQAVPTVAAPNNLTWSVGPFQAPQNLSQIGFNIYKAIGGVFGLIGTSTTTSFSDTGFTPTTSQQPPNYTPYFFGAGNWPVCSTFYQQRHIYAGGPNNPETVWASAVGFYDNFSTNTPEGDSDAVVFDVATNIVTPIQNLLDVGNLIIFTQTEEFAVMGNNTGGQFGALTPTAINLAPQSFHGSAALRALAVGQSAIFLQSRGTIIRDLFYTFTEDKYKGNDLTVFATHLFDNFQVQDMDYSEIPTPILWVVRSDGQLLALTYNRDQEIVAWTRNDTQGTFQNVAVIPEGNDDAIYVAVQRNVVNQLGATVQRTYIERFQSRIVEIEDQTAMIFMDAAGTFDGTNYGETTMELTGGVNWTRTEKLTLTASVSFFNSSQVGQQIHFNNEDGDLVRFTIGAVTSATVATGNADKTVPTWLRNEAVTEWGYATNILTNIWWLNGQQVSVLADGYVISSPNNPNMLGKFDPLTVENGQITLPKCYVKANVGLPYITDLETLDVDVVGYSVFMGQTAVDKFKLLSRLVLQVVETRGVYCGTQNPDTDPLNVTNPNLEVPTTYDPLLDLNEFKPRNVNDNPLSPPNLKTDNIPLEIQGDWDIHGRVFMRQVDPLPFTLSAIALAGNVPLRQQESSAPPPQAAPGRG